MSNNQKFFSGFFLGAAAGAVVAKFLQSEQGQDFLHSAKNNIKELSSELKNSIENIDTTVENWIGKGRNLIAELKNHSNTKDMYDYEEIFS